VVAIAAGAADVDGIGGGADRDHPGAHGAGGAGDFAGGLAAFGERDKKGGDAFVHHGAIEHGGESGFGFSFLERRSGDFR
jgi:hypothetical protein